MVVASCFYYNCYLSQAKEYGRCVAEKVPEIERDMCSKEFLALKTCMSNAVCHHFICYLWYNLPYFTRSYISFLYVFLSPLKLRKRV